MKKILIALILLGSYLAKASAQDPVATEAMPATDISASAIREFIDGLPRDAVTDRAIRVVPVTGDMRLGVFGVYRPKAFPGDANLHEVNTTEIYYMLKGSATLVTGGTLVDAYRPESSATSLRGPRIEGGVSRRIMPGDVVIIPGRTPHWWSELETDIEYLIFRPDPDNRLRIQ